MSCACKSGKVLLYLILKIVVQLVDFPFTKEHC